MPLRHQFAVLFISTTLACYAQAQEPASGSSTQKILQIEKTMSSATKDRIAAVRSADSVWCGFLDKYGVQWFGTNEGVYRYDGKTFTNYSVKDGLHNNRVFSILEDKDGNLWFGTADGLSRYDRKTFTHVPIPWNEITGPWLDKVYPVVNPNQVMSMAMDKGGIIWLGTNGAGAYRFDGETFTSFLADKGSVYEGGFHHNIIHSVLADASGDIWFGSITHAGITRYDGKTFGNFSLKDGLSDDMIRSIFQDSTGKIWFGTHGNYGASGKRNGGLDFYDGKSFTKITSDDGLLRSHVRAIYEDKNGVIWIGRGVEGMCTYDGTTLAPFVSKKGQSFNGIHFISEDAAGNMWFGGSKGKLFRYDGETVTDFSGKSQPQ